MVIINTLQLLFGFRALPAYVQYIEINSRHTFGILGAVIEVIIIWLVLYPCVRHNSGCAEIIILA